MHAAADCGDAEAIKHLAAKVQDKIADEEDWDAQKLASVQQCKAGLMSELCGRLGDEVDQAAW